MEIVFEAVRYKEPRKVYLNCSLTEEGEMLMLYTKLDSFIRPIVR